MSTLTAERTAEKTDNRAAVTEERAGKYLAFHVGPEQFAIGVLSVREIMGMQEITAIPHTPVCVKGIINLRGKVVPVIDLRLKFGMPETGHTARTCIIVVNLPGEAGSVMAGVIVDAVSEVANIAGGEIENPPDFGEGVSIPYLIGIAKTRGGVKLLLNIERVLTASDVSGIGHLLS
jgi:purine-binding chemotaxis protein CheW